MGQTLEPTPERNFLDSHRVLIQSIDPLDRVTHESEEEFLHMGGRLQEFVYRSREAAAKANTIASAMGGSLLEHAIESLRKLKDEIQRMESGTGQGKDVLNTILARFRGIRLHFRQLERITKQIDIICVLLKIENARFEESATGFQTVADNLKSLGNEIRAKSMELEERSASLDQLIHRNLADISQNEKRQAGDANPVLNRILSNLGQLGSKRELSSSMLGELSSEYQTIARHISDIVASLQSHDITRQRIEHATDAIRKTGLPAECEAATHDDIAFISDVSRIQSVQLRLAKDDFEQAVARLKQNLLALVQEINSITMQARKLAGQSEAGGTSFLADLENGLDSIVDAYSEYASINGHILSSMSSVADSVEEMASFTDDIQRIGKGVKISVLNASLNAARIGKDGITLGVLAKETRHLASQTANEIVEITEALNGVTGLARSLSSSNTEGTKWTRDAAAAFGKEIREIVMGMQAADGNADKTLQEIEGLGGSLFTDVSDAVGQFRSPALLIGEIEKVSLAIDDLVAGSRLVLPEGFQSSRRSEIEAMEASYTMQQERDVHRSCLEPSGDSECLSVEVDPGLMDSGGADDLGDNVELF